MFVKSINHLIRKITSFPRSAEIAFFAGVIIYLVQAFIFAHTGSITMDEGTYLTKGLYFVNGTYRPFQDYGPLTNKMPFSYLIPGLFQQIFGPGLRNGRYLSIIFGLLLVIALWIITRRMAGKWWAAGIVLAFAINPANISYYSTAITQGMTACLLAWVYVCILGENRPWWQIIAGSFLASLIILTRQNMFPIIGLVPIYIFWQHGWKKGTVGLAVSILFLVFVHAIYSPAILLLWLDMLPKSIFPFLAGIKSTTGPGASQTWDPNFNVQSKLYVFWEGVRFNFFNLLGPSIVWILWNRRNNWVNDTNFKAAVFLSAVLVSLLGIHMYAGLGQDYCLYCYSGYLAFFSFTGSLLFAVAYTSRVRQAGFLRQTAVAFTAAIGTVGIFYGAYQELDNFFLNIPVPRIRGMEFQGGTTELWRTLTNKFGWSYEILQQALPAAAGVLLAFLLVGVPIIMFVSRKKQGNGYQPGLTSFYIFFIVCIALSPTSIMGGGKTADTCGWDVIRSHEAVGSHLASLVPSGSLVYWQNDLSPLPLLYIPGVKVFPAQLNHWYTYREGGDANLLEKKGYWNAELARKWKLQSDFVLLADKYVNTWYNDKEISPLFDEMDPAPNTVPCRDRSIIHIFKRIQ